VVFSANTSWNLINFRGNLIIAFQQAGFRVVAITPRDSHSPALAAMGVEFFPVDFRSAGISPLHDAALFFRYWLLLRRIRPAVFLGFTIKPNIYGSLAARMLRIPVINNISGLGTAFIKNGMLTLVATQLYRLALKHSATVFFQNQEDRDQFVAGRMVSPAQSRLLPGSGVDLERFLPAPLFAGQPFRFLLIGRLLWDKGVGEYAAAARIVRQRHPDARFQILGFADVDNRTAVPRDTLHRWIGEGLIDHLGAADDVRPFIQDADCVVLPSYREGLPRSLLEASAMARPIVATDVPGSRDVIENGVTGLLCEARNADSLAEAMLAMIAKSVDQRLAMGLAGRSRVERLFAIDVVTRRYADAVDAAARRT
jgi:glycosyltransferase involved in cell wall biosynthesis